MAVTTAQRLTPKPATGKTVSRGAGPSPRTFRTTLVCVLVSVVFAVVLSLLQNFKPSSARTTLCFDSGHYMATVQMLTIKLQAALHHTSPGKLAEQYQLDLGAFDRALLLDGPLLPFLGTVIFGIIGHVPTGADRAVFVLFETVFQALTAAGACLLVGKLTGRSLWGLAAGTLWAFYPPAIAGCDSFLTEVPVTGLLVACIFALSKLLSEDVRTVPPAVWAIVAGCCGAAVIMTKPALLFALAFVAAAFLLLGRSRKHVNAKTLTTLLVSAALTFAPWVAWTHQLSHQWIFSAYRTPTYNVAKGSDPTSDGWLTIPSTPYTARFFEWLGPGHVLKTIWQERPLQSLNLIARKTERLFSHPWNDFGYAPLGLHAPAQTFVHRVLLASGIFGALLFCFSVTPLPAAAVFIGIASLALIAGHLVYLPFEALPRYAYTAMPFLLVFACFGLFRLRQLGATKLGTLSALAAILLCALLLSADLLPATFALVSSAHAAYLLELAAKLLLLLGAAFCSWTFLQPLSSRPYERVFGALSISALVILCSASLVAHAVNETGWREWKAKLTPGSAAVRAVSLNVDRLPASALLLIDGDTSLSDAQVVVNGHQLSRPASVYSYDSGDYPIAAFLRVVAAAQGKSPIAFRQWRAVPVPPEFLRLRGLNELAVLSTSVPVTVYGAYPTCTGKDPQLPSISYMSPSKIFDGQVLETRIPDEHLPTPQSGVCRLELHGLANAGDLSAAPGTQCGSYRIYLALLNAKGDAPPSASVVETKSFQHQFSDTDFSKIQTRADAMTLANSAVQTVCLPGYTQPHLAAELTGVIRTAAAPASVVIALTGHGGQPSLPIALGEEPTFVNAKSTWEPFSVSYLVPTRSFPGGLRSLSVAIAGTANSAVQLKGVTLKVYPVSAPDMTEHNLALY